MRPVGSSPGVRCFLVYKIKCKGKPRGKDSIAVIGPPLPAAACCRYKAADQVDAVDEAAAAKFTAEVDSAAVMVNASTRFNDGGELGLGAEIGISTDKFHARGPCGLRELTSYKYVVQGSGQVR